MGARAEKKAATRAAIATAMQQLVAQDGYEAATIDAVTAAAGVSRATFFRYFPTKEAAFFVDQQAHLRRFSAQMRDAAGGEDVLGEVRSACLALAAQYEQEREARLAQHRVIVQTPSLSDYDAQLDAQWEAALASALAERFAGPDARAAAGAIIGVMRAVVRDWFASDGRTDLVAAGERAFALLHDGLRATAR